MIARALYRSATGLAAPLIGRYLDRRLAEGREDAARFGERRGIAGLARPAGPLVWIHAASNGEAMSALPLVDRLLARDPAGHVLMTTGTLTSAALMERRLPARALHQFVPVDRTPWVRAFLRHWQPDAGIWVESELWPNLIWEMRDAGRPVALVNGRVSARSHARWRRVPGLASDLLAGFDPCLAQTDQAAADLRALGAAGATCVGNLKLSLPPLPADPEALSKLREAVGGRPVWLAASTHPGEEKAAAQVHHMLAAEMPDLLTIVVPRHPRRGPEIAALLEGEGLRVARRAAGAEVPAADRQIYLADTLGELGLFYALAPVAFVGGSLGGGHGGHNPIEPVQLGCAVVFGPDMENFATIAAALKAAGGAVEADGIGALSMAVGRLLTDAEARRTRTEAARRVAEEGAGAAERVMARLEAMLPPPAGREAG
jgi:3-deoxy-D-manno-octulosonic-acid transferase